MIAGGGKRMNRRTLVIFLAACAAGLEAAAGTLPPARAVFTQLESRLLQAYGLEIDFESDSEGVYPAHFAGELRARKPDQVDLKSKGSFAGEQMALELSAIEGWMQGGRVEGGRFDAKGPFVWESMLLGMTRLGVLHNQARFSGGEIPDHADVGVGEWLLVQNVRWSERAAERDNAWGALQFDIQVEGTHVAVATLWLDDDGLPLFREQTVFFEGGSMVASESYHIEIADPQTHCPPCRQEMAVFDHQLYVENGFERIYVCCTGCAAKMSGNWAGYRAILHELGEDSERLTRPVDGPKTVNPLEKGVCAECLGGRCDRPEHLPKG
jgi:hypothetical protein